MVARQLATSCSWGGESSTPIGCSTRLSDVPPSCQRKVPVNRHEGGSNKVRGTRKPLQGFHRGLPKNAIAYTGESQDGYVVYMTNRKYTCMNKRSPSRPPIPTLSLCTSKFLCFPVLSRLVSWIGFVRVAMCRPLSRLRAELVTVAIAGRRSWDRNRRSRGSCSWRHQVPRRQTGRLAETP